MNTKGIDLRGLLEFEDNRKCIDCRVGKSEYVLIEFGGFICKSCFSVHSQLGLTDKIQHVNDPISEENLKIFINGGNSALFEYWQIYDLNYKAISYKYLTLSTVYYREMLASIIVNGDYYQDLPSLEKAIQPSEQTYKKLGPEPDFIPKGCPQPKKFSKKLEETWENFTLNLSEFIKTIKHKLKIHP